MCGPRTWWSPTEWSSVENLGESTNPHFKSNVRLQIPFFNSKVHITEQTRRYLGNEYEYEPGLGEQNDPLLAKYNIKTHLISPPDRVCVTLFIAGL